MIASWTLKDVTKNGFNTCIWASGKVKVVWLIPTKESYSFFTFNPNNAFLFHSMKKIAAFWNKCRREKNKRLHLAQKPDT